VFATTNQEIDMEKNASSDIATFPELFSEMEQFIEEFMQGVKRAGFRLAMLASSGATLAALILGKLG
jgi:phosphate-selective porin